jgi:hypothetical protein
MRLVIAACLCACQSAAATDRLPGDDPPPSEDRFERDMLVRFHMHENFDLVRTIEKRIIHGRLDEARELARALAAAPEEPGFAPLARHQMLVRDRAAALARAQRIDEACIAEARLAVACAGCHVDANVAPEFKPSKPAPIDESTVQSRMARHVWATDRLWEGIVGGEDEAWLAGLDVLAAAPLKEPSWSGDRARLALQLQRLAADARKRYRTDTQAERARAYGGLLITCSACHVEAPAR